MNLEEELKKNGYCLKVVSNDMINITANKNSKKIAFLMKGDIKDEILSEIQENLKNKDEIRIFNLNT